METDLYSFAFRALLTETALDKTSRISRISLTSNVDAGVAARLPISALDENLVSHAKRMATVYVVVAAFENTVREFVSKRLLEIIGADWWATAVPEKIRIKAETRMTQEAKVRWHTPRGDEPLNYTEFGDLHSIIASNWQHFENHLQSQEWTRQIMSVLERSRNVIMHSGDLGLQDVERVGSAVRDWIRQVGA